VGRGGGEGMNDFVNQISRVAATFQPREKDSGTNRTGFVKLSKATKAANKAIGCSLITPIYNNQFLLFTVLTND
jgi:hypothetical protein